MTLSASRACSCLVLGGIFHLLGCSSTTNVEGTPHDTGGTGAVGAMPGVGGAPGSGGAMGTGAVAAGTGATGAEPGVGGTGTGGVAPTTGGSPGVGGTGGSTEPAPMIQIDPGRTDRKDIDFSPTDADQAATPWHGDQRGSFDGGKTVQGKLVVTMGGIGGGPHTGGTYQWAVGRGFHVIAVDMFNSEGGESNQGLVYMETFSGEDLTPVANVTPVNSVMGRIKAALTYLNTYDPGASWDFYLDAQGEIRWEDVILFGYSYGGQTALAATKYVAPYRTILTAAPTLPDDCTWISDRQNVADVTKCFAIASDGDEEKYEKLMTAGWPGTPQLVMNDQYDMILQPPFNDSSMIQAPGGHTEFCSVAGDRYDVICDFVFDVTP